MHVVAMFLAAVAAFAVTNAIQAHWIIEAPIWFAVFGMSTSVMWWAYQKVMLRQ